MTEKLSKSQELKELKRKLSRQKKEKQEGFIKEKLDTKKLDYDTISLIIEIFEKSKFSWQKEHFGLFDKRPNEFRGRELPKNNRECIMLGVRLGMLRSKIIFNLRDRQVTVKERQYIDDVLWNLVWHHWKEARTLYDFLNKDETRGSFCLER
ncbi:MAG: hypothetical protein ACE5DU_02525 [Nitrosopumilus sp.]